MEVFKVNDWYIDRSKNFLNNTFDPVINYLYKHNESVNSRTIISAFIDNNIFDEESGNLFAALTRFRDHGLIDNNNKIGESAVDYVEKRLAREDLIIDLFTKRPANKKNSVNLKPLILLCVVFEIMFEIVADTNEVYLTYDECFKYLYSCNSLSDITIDYVDAIIVNRTQTEHTTSISNNEVTNLSIWFNALNNTPIFIPTEERTIIRPNYYARPFIKYIAINGFRISETPTYSNTALYNYYCNRDMGISEVIPNIFMPNVIVSSEYETKVIFNYIFGIKKEPDFNFSRFFENDCFGVYYPFILIPRLAIRKIWVQNKILGNSLFNFLNKQVSLS